MKNMKITETTPNTIDSTVDKITTAGWSPITDYVKSKVDSLVNSLVSTGDWGRVDSSRRNFLATTATIGIGWTGLFWSASAYADNNTHIDDGCHSNSNIWEYCPAEKPKEEEEEEFDKSDCPKLWTISADTRCFEKGKKSGESSKWPWFWGL